MQLLGKHLTGRPHFAKVLLRKGYVKISQEALDRYLADNASASVERDEPELSRACACRCATAPRSKRCSLP